MTEQSAHGVVDGEVEAYLRRVSDRLGDVPDRTDLVDELREHLVEVHADNPDVELTVVIGSPESYADEMRTASGLPPWRPATRGTRARVAAVGRWLRASSVPVGRDLRGFWWGIRGLALGLFALVLLDAVRYAAASNEWFGLWSFLLSPSRAFDVLVGAWWSTQEMTLLVILLVCGLATSVWAGGRMARCPVRPWVSSLVIVLGALLGLWFATVFWDLLTTAVFAHQQELWESQAQVSGS